MTSTAVETYRGVTYISTDSHVTEPIELYAERVDAEYREAPLNPRHRGYDPHVAERYASKKTVRRMR